MTLRSVIGIDRTFNLGPCFVTALVYKNKSAVRKTNNEHPIFLGPVATQSLWTTAILYLYSMRKRQLSMLFEQSFTLQVSKHYEAFYINPTKL